MFWTRNLAIINLSQSAGKDGYHILWFGFRYDHLRDRHKNISHGQRIDFQLIVIGYLATICMDKQQCRIFVHNDHMLREEVFRQAKTLISPSVIMVRFSQRFIWQSGGKFVPSRKERGVCLCNYETTCLFTLAKLQTDH